MPEKRRPGDPRMAPVDRGGAPVETAVLQGVRRRDPEALGRFFDVAFGFVYNLALRLTGNRDTAEDVTQEVFLKVYRAGNRLDADRSPYPWLTAVTTNTCRDLARRGRTRAERPLDAALESRDNSAGPEDVLVRHEETRLLERALRTLDDSQRAVVVLHAYGGRSHEEIAGILGATPAAIRKRYSRALQALRTFVRKPRS